MVDFKEKMSISDIQSYYDGLDLDFYEVSPIGDEENFAQVKLAVIPGEYPANIIPREWSLDRYGNPIDPRQQIRLKNLNALQPILRWDKFNAALYNLGFGVYDETTRCFRTTDPREATHLELNCFYDFRTKKDLSHKEHFEGEVVRFTYEPPQLQSNIYDFHEQFFIKIPDRGDLRRFCLETAVKQAQKALDNYDGLVDYCEELHIFRRQIELIAESDIPKKYGCTYDLKKYCFFITTKDGKTQKFYYTSSDVLQSSTFLTEAK